MLGSIRGWLFALLVAALAVPCLAQDTAKVTLETSETIFSVLAAMNQCGYDDEVGVSNPLRAQIRQEVTVAVQRSGSASRATAELCEFYRDHKQADATRDLAQYVSLALNLGDPPAFAPVIKESDLPPDASYVLGLLPILQRFYTATELHSIWRAHARQYDALVDRFHDPVTKLLLQTDVYLRYPISGFLGRRFVIYIDPLAAPGQVNARNYGSDYFMVVSPDGSDRLNLQPIRHTYLHFILDPLVAKRANQVARLQPLLATVKNAPIDDTYKRDIGLLLTESLIRAIEARLSASGKAAEPERLKKVDASMREGFVLTRVFYDLLGNFEKGEVGLRDAFYEWLYNMDVDHERKRASEIQFTAQAAPEVVRPAPAKPTLLAQAEARLAANDPRGAQEFAQQALDGKKEDAGRALFILGQAASMNKDIDGATNYFTRVVETSREPFFVARAHIYLGRIFDLKQEREEAVKHYRAALAVDNSPSTKAAAERGLKEPYAPPRRDNQDQ